MAVLKIGDLKWANFFRLWTSHQIFLGGGTTFLTKTHMKIWGEFWIGIISAKKYLTVCCQLGCNLR